jgi:hypothetical protein
MAEPQVNELPPDRRGPGKPDDPNGPADGDGGSGGSGDTVAEYVTLDNDTGDFVFTPDGDDELVTLGEPYEAPEQVEFYDNLAEVFGPRVCDEIATRLLDKIEQDKEARSKRTEQYEEGIRRTGLGKDAPGGADFEGASKVVHPMLTEAAIDYEARVIKELMPTAGPVKEKIVGVATKEKSERAKRKVEHMNWQITSQIKEARSTMETMLTQVPLAGAQYLHQRWDHNLKRPRWEFVPLDNCYFPYSATDWHSAFRRTIRWTIPTVEVMARMDSGLYREVELGIPALPAGKSKAADATDKVAGKDEPSLNTDGDRVIFETMEIMPITAEMAECLQACGGDEEEGDLRPFLVSIDEETREVLAIYRDWEERDEAHEPIEHTYEFPFIYWRDGNVGFPHIIGGLSAAATGALRALLDSAHIQNAATGVILKGSGTSGTTVQTKPGELATIDAGVEADDIRKRVMQFPGAGPSNVLLQLLGILVDSAKGTVRTSLDELATDQQPNTPVGTTMARQEEGMVVFSAIHGRVHNSFNRVLKGLHRLNRLYLPKRLCVDNDGQEILVYRADYEGPCNIEPTSNPTIYSEQQRAMQIQAVQQRATALPQIYKVREVEKWFLESFKIPDSDRFLNDIPQPHELNAVNENLSLLMGKPVVAFPEQDHAAHLSVLLDFMESFGLNPLFAQKFLPGAIQHAIEHIGYLYVGTTTDLIAHAAGREAQDLMSADNRVKKRFDQLLGVASKIVVPQVLQLTQRAMPILAKAQQVLAAMQPQMPMDPAAQASAAAAMAETKRKSDADQIKRQTDQERNAIAADANQVQRERTQVDASTKIATTSQDNQTAEDIAAMRVHTGQAPGFTDGASMRGS